MAHQELHAYVEGTNLYTDMRMRIELAQTSLREVIAVAGNFDADDRLIHINGNPVGMRELHKWHSILG